MFFFCGRQRTSILKPAIAVNSGLQMGCTFDVACTQHGGIRNKGQDGYPADVGGVEWHYVTPYLALCRADAPQRRQSLLAVLNGLRWPVKRGHGQAREAEQPDQNRRPFHYFVFGCLMFSKP